LDADEQVIDNLKRYAEALPALSPCATCRGGTSVVADEASDITRLAGRRLNI
jgi:hypothetical protein